MKILLIDIPLKDVDNGFNIVHKEILFPSLGLYYLKEYAKLKNPNIDIKVLNLSNKSFEEALDIVILEKPDIVGASCFTDRRAIVFEFLKALKKINSKIINIIGGPHSSILPRQIMSNYDFIDFIVIGEGEQTFSELIDCLITNKNFEKINGLCFRKKNEIIETQKRQPIENLDELPYPRYENFDDISVKFTHYDDRYLFKGRKISALKTASIITSRGCPFQCTYCSTSAYWGRKVRYRSAQNVVDEIEYLYKTHNVEFINIVDDAFTINKKRVLEICKLLIEKKIEICWICETNVKTIDAEMLEIMEKSGCFAINYGVESGAPVILKNIKKNITQSEIINAINLADKFGIIADIFLMVGNPGETNKTINETLAILKETKVSSGGWGILTIFPGTELYENCKKNNYINDDYWLSAKSSPFYLYEQPYLKLSIFLTKIKLFFLRRNKKYKLWLRYYLLNLRDWIFLYTGIKLSFKKKIQLLFKDKRRYKQKSVL